ncbi:hypothetical protein LSS_00775 [Leptospira santarosai serovar Shermani str. LT 821]|uniref:Uncharacterized protein n=1 Tax=Leptospira santarosai serovar Shermani str. LT 821 TaxID=758847 RepID=K8Y7C9_9LEPT|nr:hypothetical protein LSS_00775 [Leptospira santarosai serovar Shermani str. LT 821]
MNPPLLLFSKKPAFLQNQPGIVKFFEKTIDTYNTFRRISMKGIVRRNANNLVL